MDLLEKLSDFNLLTRKEALLEVKALIQAGKIKKYREQKPWINMHLHTFHSFNYKNWSPSRVVLEAWRTGLKYAGTVDFDTLAGLQETLQAGKLLGEKVTGGFESRVFIKELEDKVINSPKEPGIFYLCGKGFRKPPEEESEEGKFFAEIKNTAQARNREVVNKLNGYLKDVTLDYEKEVMPLAPSGNPTERHIILAYLKKSKQVLREKTDEFWAEILGSEEKKISFKRTEKPQELQGEIRKKLVKFGGPGYIKAEGESFPPFERVVEMTKKAGGIPVGTWLDGTSEGESEPGRHMEFLKSRGIKIMTIIPERNYNIRDKEEKRLKVSNLNKFMEVCKKMDMPVVCGTEMNKHGQPFVDDFNQPEIAKYLSYFLRSAEIFFN
jgi:hypothetical protein